MPLLSNRPTGTQTVHHSTHHANALPAATVNGDGTRTPTCPRPSHLLLVSGFTRSSPTPPPSSRRRAPPARSGHAPSRLSRRRPRFRQSRHGPMGRESRSLRNTRQATPPTSQDPGKHLANYGCALIDNLHLTCAATPLQACTLHALQGKSVQMEPVANRTNRSIKLSCQTNISVTYNMQRPCISTVILSHPHNPTRCDNRFRLLLRCSS